jgi:hypothetical protein
MLFILFSVQGFVAISKIICEIYVSIEAEEVCGRASSNTKHHFFFFCASLDYLCFRENFTSITWKYIVSACTTSIIDLSSVVPYRKYNFMEEEGGELKEQRGQMS